MRIIQNIGINDLDDVSSHAYVTWKSMLNRCYSSSSHPCYKNSIVCDEWLTFSVFKLWYKNNYVDGFELDKDLIDPSSKIYSPSTCVFAPSAINKLTTNMDNKGKYVTGVTYHKSTGKFRARVSHENKRVSLGLFDNELAAYTAYLRAKIEVFVYHGTNTEGKLSGVLFNRANKIYREYKQKLKELQND